MRGNRLRITHFQIQDVSDGLRQDLPLISPIGIRQFSRYFGGGQAGPFYFQYLKIIVQPVQGFLLLELYSFRRLRHLQKMKSPSNTPEITNKNKHGINVILSEFDFRKCGFGVFSGAKMTRNV